MKTRTLTLMFSAIVAAAPVAAQTDVHASARADVLPATARTVLHPPRLDARLVVRDAARPTDARLQPEVVARPRWRYPAIGAAVGIAAGLIHASSMQDPIGFPVGDPIYVMPAVYGLAGAFVGLLIDSAERERAARR